MKSLLVIMTGKRFPVAIRQDMSADAAMRDIVCMVTLSCNSTAWWSLAHATRLGLQLLEGSRRLGPNAGHDQHTSFTPCCLTESLSKGLFAYCFVHHITHWGQAPFMLRRMRDDFEPPVVA